MRKSIVYCLVPVVLLLGMVATLSAGTGEEAVVEHLREQIATQGLTFEVAPNPATSIELDQLCVLTVPDKWWRTAKAAELPDVRLPVAFDWRDFGKVTPVRLQVCGGAGWAYATVATLESRILFDGGPATDLSERYLLQCNDQGWGCDGGWFAHDIHVKDGAVYESCPLEPQCDCPHPYKATGWQYVSGSNSVPSTVAIKTAMLKYGPVAAAVYVDAAFQYYMAGIFNGTAAGQVNHAVLLVGWNDIGGYWIMKNSWGTSWGESGYMRIAYGAQQIGYAANYLTGSIACDPLTCGLQSSDGSGW